MDYLHTTDRFETFSDGTDRLARGLGWLSIGIGVAELIYGRRLSQSVGIGDHGALLRGYGLREIGTGLAILFADDPKIPMWGRVIGDALDLATLMPGLDADNPDRDRVKLAMAAVGAITVVDLLCTQALHARDRMAPEPPDYSDRSGYDRPASEMVGAARDDRGNEAEDEGGVPASPTPGNQTRGTAPHEAVHATDEDGIPASPTPLNQTASADRPLRGGDGI